MRTMNQQLATSFRYAWRTLQTWLYLNAIILRHIRASLTATLANINPAVKAVQGDYTPRNSANAGFVQSVAEMNVQLTMKKLLDRSMVLRKMVDKGELGLVGAMYDMTTGKVMFYK